MKKIKLTANILFSGIGCQEYGWRKSNLFDIEVLNTSDIYKEAVLSYAAIHCDMTNEMVDSYDYPTKEEMIEHLTKINLGYDADKNKPFNWNKVKDNDLKKYYLACKLTNNLGDISKIEDLPYADFWTISFPCQSISICGKLKGFTEGSNTRSSLLWENIRLLKIAKEKNKTPKYLMFENVKNLLSKRFENDFKDLIDILDDLGFNIYYNVLNSKCCGVPQNRERVFVICIRKDIDTKLFTFPKPFDNGMRLKDVLENEVDEKYYISEAAQKKLKFITTNDKNDTFQLKQIAQMYGTDKEPNPQAGRVYNEDYICPTLDTCSGGNRMPKVYREPRVRKLTPRECFALQGFTFEDCDKAINIGIVDSHLYKQAGNGITTNCCALLAEHLYKSQYDNSYICSDEKY